MEDLNLDETKTIRQEENFEEKKEEIPKELVFTFICKLFIFISLQ